MNSRHSPDVFFRWEGNPIIQLEDLPFQCNSICNAGAAKVDGEYLLLLTIETLSGTYLLVPARSLDGYHFRVEDQPILMPSTDAELAPHEERGVQDARLTPLDGGYYIAYDAVGRHGYRLGLAATQDFRSVRHIGLVSEPDTKGGALFPCKVGERYARVERPWEGRSIWISYSDDLEFWGSSEVVLTPRGGFWDCSRVGVAAPPAEIPEGFLLTYYGVKETSAGPLFRLGAAILNKENPVEVVGRTNVPVLSPREYYERMGDVNNLVFSCGMIVEPNGEVKLYYGAANACICVGTTGLEQILAACHESTRDF